MGRDSFIAILMALGLVTGPGDPKTPHAEPGLIAVSAAELREVERGWSVRKQILGKDVFNPSGERIGTIDDLIMAHERDATYAIVGVGSFVGVAMRSVAVPVKQLKQTAGRIVLPGATKDALKGLPAFEYAK